MVIIITGATHTGKTLLAQKLLEKYHYPYLSIDSYENGPDTERAYVAHAL